MAAILLVDDDERFGPRTADYLGRFGYQVNWVASLAAARDAFEQTPPGVAVVDMMLPDGSGMELVAACAECGVPSIVVTGHATLEHAVGSVRARASDFLIKPFKLEELKERLDELLAGATQPTATAGKTPRRRQKPTAQEDSLGPLIGRSPAMRVLYDSIQRVAPTAATVLIIGESGTGKELVANALHELSPRADGPFVAVNCGAVVEELIASELFGHERGSFTGANRQHVGVFERATGGTLFLDEITEMPLELQANLLRVLEVGTFRRVGGTAEIKADVRLVAATNRAPDQAVKDKQLREDLFFRLSEFPIEAPPLRARSGDVALLAERFLAEYSSRYEVPKLLDDSAREKLERYDWPGNVRELRNVIHGAYIIGGETIGGTEIEGRIRLSRGVRSSTDRIAPGTTIRDMERQLIERTLAHFGGDKPQTAKALGISLKTLYNRLNAYESETDPEPEAP